MLKDSLIRQAESIKHSQAHACVTLPPNISEILCRDPRLIGFIAARHKMVAKIFEGLDVLEIGCQEGFGTLFVAPYVKSITSIDFYGPFIHGFKQFSLPHMKNCKVQKKDITQEYIPRSFQGIFALDVLEHIDAKNEDLFWCNVSASLADSGTVIVGMPSLESQVYASEASKIGHVNCKSGMELKKTAQEYFSNVIILSMNDEMIHNGYLPMSHYIFVICSGKIC